MTEKEIKSKKNSPTMWEAFAKAQSEIKVAEFNKVNPQFKSKYADLSSIWTACKEALNKNGFSIVQRYDILESGEQLLLTELYYKDGNSITSTFKLNVMKGTPQEMGSLTTYARRYSLSALVGIIADEDDDANAAQEAIDTTGTRFISAAQYTLLVSKLRKLNDDSDEIIKRKLGITDLKEIQKQKFQEILNWVAIKEKGSK